MGPNDDVLDQLDAINHDGGETLESSGFESEEPQSTANYLDSAVSIQVDEIDVDFRLGTF